MGKRDQPSGKPLLDKLAVKPESRISALGLEEWFLDELRSRTADVTVDRLAPNSDLIVLFVRHRDELDAALAPVESALTRNGAVWVVRPKGQPDIKENDVIDAGKRAGFVDNKIASFSDTLSAMRLVIPVSRR